MCFAKFTDPIRIVTDIRRMTGGYPPSGPRVPEAEDLTRRNHGGGWTGPRMLGCVSEYVREEKGRL